jgi:hypothetical protein
MKVEITIEEEVICWVYRPSVSRTAGPGDLMEAIITKCCSFTRYCEGGAISNRNFDKDNEDSPWRGLPFEDRFYLAMARGNFPPT